MVMVYLVVIVIATTTMFMSSNAQGQCSPEQLYLPRLTSQYVGGEPQNHIIPVTEGQTKIISCQVGCSGVTDDLINDIEVDWLLMNPNTFKIYAINAVTDRNRFRREFGMDFRFSNLSDGLRMCSSNAVSNASFSATLLNYNVSLEELLVICGIKRMVCPSYSHLIEGFALLKLKHQITPSTPDSSLSTLTTLSFLTSPTIGHERLVSTDWPQSATTSVATLATILFVFVAAVFVVINIAILLIIRKKTRDIAPEVINCKIGDAVESE